MPNQRSFVIALWTILSVGAVAMIARSHAAAQQPGDLSNPTARMDAAQGAPADKLAAITQH